VIQPLFLGGFDGTDGFDGRPMEEDGAALFGQGDGPGPQRWQQSAVCGSGSLEGPYKQPLARPARGIGRLEHRFQTLRRQSARGVFAKIFAAVSDDPDMEYAMIDATIVPVHRHGHGAKGGLKIRRSASPRAAGRPKSSR
jgi:hypothetical protein